MINPENGHQSTKISFKPSALSTVANQVWKTTATSDESASKNESLANLVDPPKFQSEKDPGDFVPHGDKKNGKTFVFGSNICSRVTGSASDSGDASTSTAVSAFSDTQKLTSDDIKCAKSNGTGLSLQESAAEHEAKTKQSVSTEPVDCVTGEEGETNVLAMSCKLHWFDGEKQTWVERGRGVLRLNDHCRQDDQLTEQSTHSRVVMRCQGSLRVILNTKIWPDMHIERVRPKSLKISALDSDKIGSAFSLHLINAPVSEIDALESALSVRRTRSSPIKSMPAPASGGGAVAASEDANSHQSMSSSPSSTLSEATRSGGSPVGLKRKSNKPGESDLSELEGSGDSVDAKKPKCDDDYAATDPPPSGEAAVAQPSGSIAIEKARSRLGLR